jgi:osmotically-inducible protein OsmY
MSKTHDVGVAVAAELAFDPLLDDWNVRVANLKGDVSLRGTVASYPEYVEAVAATRRVSGVTTVHNHLKVDLPDANRRSDAALTTAANSALMWDVSVPDAVEATAVDGDLYLEGQVRFKVERDAAVEAVSGLTGVRSVKNDIQLVFDADPIDVTLLVQSALDRWALILDDSSVYVDTDGDTVTLSGHVRSWAEHDAVLNAAWMAAGVTEVRDDVLVTG